jgi:hypothetical protein
MHFKTRIVVIILVITVLIVSKIVMLSSIKFDIDHLQDLLLPLNNKITKNSRVCFVCNEDDYYSLYLETKMIITPNLTQDLQKSDTVILIQRKKNGVAALIGYKVIGESKNDQLSIYLLTKNK